MPQQFTQEQIEKLKNLGIEVKQEKASPLVKGRSGEAERGFEPESLIAHPDTSGSNGDVDLSTEGFKPTEPEVLTQPEISPFPQGEMSEGQRGLDKKKTLPVFPLLSISGLTLLSFGGLVLLKGNGSTVGTDSRVRSSAQNQSSSEVTPTQVPKSIQHYLLTSQQYFSQAVQLQNENRPVKGGGTEGDGGFQNQSVELLNNSILAATQAIKEFPDDYRGYQQRGNIYQALTSSKPDLIDQSISDFASAFKLNSNSAEITRSLASLYAKKGDANKTILYLNQTVALEPTKAQNFYDLAKIQQQVGLLSQALDTYSKLTTLVTDPTQKTQVESEKAALEKLVAQNPNSSKIPTEENQTLSPITAPSSLDSPTIQAMGEGGLIIAAPEEDKSITVTNQTESNSLSGTSILSSSQKEITISNNNISSTSQVYVTVTKGGKNQNLQVLSKTDKSFVVGLDSPIFEDIEFKWWIIN